MISSIFTGIGIIIFIITLSIFIGNWIKNKFNILLGNTYITFALGFFTYIAIICISFMPIMVFALSGTTLFITWIIMNIALIAILIWQRKIINIKTINIKMIIVYICISVVVTISTRFMGSLPKGGDNIFYIPWVKNNEYISHLNEGLGIGGIYQGQGWYYFQTVILRLTHMDQNFMNLWVFGAFSNFALVSAILGFTFVLIKKDKIWVTCLAIPIALAFQWLMAGAAISNIGSSTIFIWVMVTIYVITIEFLRKEKLSLIFLIAIIGYSSWAISSSTLFVFGIFYVSVIFILIYKASNNLMHFIWINGFIIAIMLIFLNVGQNKQFLLIIPIMLLVLIGLSFLAVYYFKSLNKLIVTFLNKYMYSIFSSTFLIIFILSTIFWWMGGKDSWLNFAYNKDGIAEYWPNDQLLLLDIFKYIAYWFFSIFLVFKWIQIIKNKISIIPLDYLQMIAGISMILFFNPLVASLWNGHVIPTLVYHRVRLNVILPMYLCIIVWITKIKFKKVKKGIYIGFLLSGSASIIIPFTTQKVMRERFDVFTGYGKGMRQAAEYIKVKPLLSKYKIAGDINGINAYIDNKYSFERGSHPFVKLQYSLLTNNLYNQLTNEEQNKINILLKLDINVDQQFNYKNFGFQQEVKISHYILFIK